MAESARRSSDAHEKVNTCPTSAETPSCSSAAGSAPDGGSSSASVCLLLVAGLPGVGKSRLARAVANAPAEICLEGEPPPRVVLLEYDAAEAAEHGGPSADDGSFDAERWAQARAAVRARVESELAGASESPARTIIVLDDNFYYRSMRKEWLHVARAARAALLQVFVSAPVDECVARNATRAPGRARVPEAVLRHMAGTFEWPGQSSPPWERSTAILIPAQEDVGAMISDLAKQAANLWWIVQEVPQDTSVVEEQSASHGLDLRLRQVVSAALQGCPVAHKSRLAKAWGARKKAAVQSGGDPDAVAAAFLEQCLADLSLDAE